MQPSAYPLTDSLGESSWAKWKGQSSQLVSRPTDGALESTALPAAAWPASL